MRRLALTELDGQARDLFIRWCKEAGCTVTVDGIGNIFARRPGKDDSLPPIITGSHIDTQPSGGKFDGNYGVMSGLEVVRTLNDNRIQTAGPDRGGGVDQRRRLALHAGDDGLGRVRRRVSRSNTRCSRRISKASRSATR